jgi:hypothetical protein
MQGRFLIATAVITLFMFIANGQTLEELNEQKIALQAQAAPINAAIAEIDAQIVALTPIPAWTKGLAGTVGFNYSALNNWVINPNPNSRTSTILGSLNTFANLTKERYFWRNSAMLNLGWQKLQLDVDNDEGSEYQPTVDVLQLTSLFGYNLSRTLAASALTEFRSSVIRNAFNPAYLDIGVGATWKPSENLVVVFHPLNYNFIIAEDNTEYTSSLGCKIIADYNQEVYQGVKLRSNASAFLSYKDAQEFSNLTWTNGISFTLFKGFGIGLEYALRWNPQETQAVDSDIQRYFLIGLSYAL